MGRIDYCNSLLFGLPPVQVGKLQRIQNSAARLVCSIPRFEHLYYICYTGYQYVKSSRYQTLLRGYSQFKA